LSGRLKRDVQFDKFCTSGGEAHGNEADLYFKDFEDAVQCCSAVNAKVDCLITRNKRDYTTDILPILTPEEFFTAIAV
jgi:hypothetical protein